MAPTTAPAATNTVAKELAKLCREGRNMDAINTLYSPKAVSVEPVGDEQMPAEVSGIDAIRQKNEWWLSNHDVQAAEVTGPFVSDDQFAMHYHYDVTFKPTGQRMQMTEMALYTVEDGKIVREQFFYNVPGK